MSDASSLLKTSDVPANRASFRSCGTCTLCCTLPEIDFFDKPANTACAHCLPGSGCSIYEKRPQLCRDFVCLWLAGDDLGPEWEPAKAGMMLYRQGPQLTVLADPAFASTWRRAPYIAQLEQWARAAEPLGGYVIVFEGDAVFKVKPQPVS